MAASKGVRGRFPEGIPDARNATAVGGLGLIAEFVYKLKNHGTGSITLAATPAANPNVTVSDSRVKTDSEIHLTLTSAGGITAPVSLMASNIVDGTSFRVTALTGTEVPSSSIGFNYLIINQL